MRIVAGKTEGHLLEEVLFDPPERWGAGRPLATVRVFEPLRHYSRTGEPGWRSWREIAARTGRALDTEMDWRDLSGGEQRLYQSDGIIDAPPDGVLSLSMARVFGAALRAADVDVLREPVLAAFWCGFREFRNVLGGRTDSLTPFDQHVASVIRRSDSLVDDGEEYVVLEESLDELQRDWGVPSSSLLSGLHAQAIVFEHAQCALVADLDGTFTYIVGPVDLVRGREFRAVLRQADVDVIDLPIDADTV